MDTGCVQRLCSRPNNPMVPFVWNFFRQIQNLKRVLLRIKNQKTFHIHWVRELVEQLDIRSSPCNTLHYKDMFGPNVFGDDELLPIALITILLPVCEECLFELTVVLSNISRKGSGVGPRSSYLRLTF